MQASGLEQKARVCFLASKQKLNTLMRYEILIEPFLLSVILRGICHTVFAWLIVNLKHSLIS